MSLQRSLLIFVSATVCSLAMGQHVDDLSLRIVQGHLCIKVKVNGAFRWMAIDSGDPESSMAVSEANSDKNARVSHSIQIGSISIDQQFLGRKVGPMGQKVDGTTSIVEGILGFDVLRKVGLSFDFLNSKARVLKPGKTATIPSNALGRNNLQLVSSMKIFFASGRLSHWPPPAADLQP